MNDTIAAIGTAAGKAGVGIVRLSGPDALHVAAAVTRTDAPTQPHATLRRIVVHDPDDDSTIDDGLLAVFHAPRSFTGESVAELQVHGGPQVLHAVLDACLRHGARLARPGEFSERAFLNEKIDLSRAEGIADLVSAESDAARRAARRVADGALQRAVERAVSPLREALARIEASIDFPEEVGEIDPDTVGALLTRSAGEVASLLSGAAYGRRLTEGATVVLVGAPNAGKSSLLNALSGADRAIVAATPGTTRDVLREPIVVGGIPVTVLDTAGLRASDDSVEQIGIERARSAARTADLVLAVVDATSPQLPDGIDAGDGRTLVVVNKIDLADPEPACRAIRVSDAHPISARNGVGLTGLADAVARRLCGGGVDTSDLPLVTRARHEAALRAGAAALEKAEMTLKEGLPAELIAVDVHDAVRCLGEITGATSREEIVADIFSRFCLGK